MAAPLPPGILVALAAAVPWGVYVSAAKRYFDGVPATTLTVLVNGFALAWYVPVAATRVSPADLPAPSALGIAGALALVGSVVGIGAGYVLSIEALALGELSYVVPINRTVPLFVLPLELVLLDAVVPPLAVAGILVVTFGVYVANYRGGDPVEPLRRAATSHPARLALLSAAAYAVGDVSKRAALDRVGPPPEALVPVVLGGVALLFLPAAVRSWPDERPEVGVFVAVGLLVAVAEHLTTLAFAALPASIAAPVVNTQAVVAVLLGGRVLGEERLGGRLAAAALAVFGIGPLAV